MDKAKILFWTGWALSALLGVALTFAAFSMLAQSEEVVKSVTEQYGYPLSMLTPLGITVLVCVALFLIPQTAALGGLLLTAYLGGAVATHVHASEGFAAPIIAASLMWVALLLREPRLRTVLPIRRGTPVL